MGRTHGRTDGRTDSATTICLPKFLWGHKKYACVYVGLKVFHDVCIILYTCKSSLYFILVLFLVVVHRGPHGRLAFFLLNVLPSENKDYYLFLFPYLP